MVAGVVGSQRVARRAVLSAQLTADAAILHVAVLHVLAQVGPHLGQLAAVRALEQVPAHLDNLGPDDPVDVLEECLVCNISKL